MEPVNVNSKQQMNKMDDELLPPGFRFHPMDEELVTYYLTQKVRDSSFSCRAIADVDLNKCEPWDLPEKAKMGEKEWYFFSLRDRKYPTGTRTNRATEAGYWKATGKDREIYRGKTNTLVGMKKTLVFYKGRAPKGEKTSWVMHEYRLEGKFSYYDLPKTAKDEWVIARIFQKSSGAKKAPLGLGRSSSYLNDIDSPNLPQLLESPCIPNTAGGTLSFDSESGGSAMDNQPHVTYFSNPGYTNNHGFIKLSPNQVQPNLGSISSDSVDFTFLQNLIMGVNANSSPTQIPPHMSNQAQLPSYSMGPNSNMPGFPDLYTGGIYPNPYMFRTHADIVDERFKQCKMEEPPTFFNASGTVKNSTVQPGSSQWISSGSGYQHQNQEQRNNLESKYGIPQQQMQNQAMVTLSQETGLSSEINADISSSVVSSQQNQQYNEETPDMDSLWNSLS